MLYFEKGQLCRFYPDRIPEVLHKGNEQRRQAIAEARIIEAEAVGLLPGNVVLVAQHTPKDYLWTQVRIYKYKTFSDTQYVLSSSLELVPEDESESALAFLDLQNET